MKRTSVFVTIVFLAGLGIGYFARSAGIGTPHGTDTHAADLAAIENCTKMTLNSRCPKTKN